MRCFRYFLPFLVCASCAKPSGESTENERLRSQVYFTKEDPGLWKDFAKSHDPQVKNSGAGDIEVNVPLEAEIGHYIEIITVVDASQREIAAKSFKRGERPSARFSISPGSTAGAVAIAKCNLHGMWPKPLK